MIAIRTGSCVPQEEILRHVDLCHGLGLPVLTDKPRPPLAILGGGHSVAHCVEEVKAFDGERWIVGSSYRWWRAQGVSGRFFSIHPSIKALDNIEGVTDALVSSTTHPDVLKALSSQGKVETFDIHCCGTTSVTGAIYPAITCGYPSVSLYGFDSSYESGTHLYMDANDPWRVVVECDGEEFLTGAEFLKQAEFLAASICAAPRYFLNRSNGLLAAMVRAKGKYKPVRATKEFLSTVIFEETAHA